MPQVLDKWISYVENDLDIWKMAKTFGHGLSI